MQITLAIHTYDHAVALKKTLQGHNIKVTFEKVSSNAEDIDYGLRVKIDIADLPLALKIVESASELSLAKTTATLNGIKGNILIPIDFSDYSSLACLVGFAMAQRLNLTPVILHTFATPSLGGPIPYSDSFDPEIVSTLQSTELSISVRHNAEKLMNRFIHTIYEAQHTGAMPDIKFKHIIEEGIPEEVIIEYSKSNPPALIVMATRGKDKKEEDLIGSVTAEVLDACRVPVFTVPENYRFTDIKNIKNLAFFCTLTQRDILSIDTLMRMFNFPDVQISLIPVNDLDSDKCDTKMIALTHYLSKNYPTAVFKYKIFRKSTFKEDMENYSTSQKLELLIVPNKKMNAFRRLFNPGIAHRILFERDMPLLALPV
ncbi:MAG: universal stress protein [Prevotella sp.]|nr:universal stress protein [Bacteroides sp.]MCM1366872.1 universal stress protein [Prevotella sp.]